MGNGFGAESVRGGVDRLKLREVAAHRRAIEVHSAAVELFEGRGDTVRADAARQRAERAREMLALALTEAEQWLSRVGERGMNI